MKHDAFTLLELLVVITIIMVLVGFLIIDFNSARRFQELDLTVQQTLALMDQSRAKVDSGYVNDDDAYLCLGGYFEVGELPQLVTMEFNPDLGICDVNSKEETNYGIIQGSAIVESMSLGGEPDKIWAMFVPPEADLVFYNASGQSNDESGSITMTHSQKEELSHVLNFSTITNQVSLAENEEE